MKHIFAFILTVILILFWGMVLTSCGTDKPVVYDYIEWPDGDVSIYYSDKHIDKICHNSNHPHYRDYILGRGIFADNYINKK